MGQHTICLLSNKDRARAALYIEKAPQGTYVRFKHNKRSKDQNSRMWVLLGFISKQMVWIPGEEFGYIHISKIGENMLPFVSRFSADDWKDYFCYVLSFEARWMPAENGGMIPLGFRTSQMDKPEHSDLTTLIEEFGARHGVDFEEPQQRQRIIKQAS